MGSRGGLPAEYLGPSSLPPSAAKEKTRTFGHWSKPPGSNPGLASHLLGNSGKSPGLFKTWFPLLHNRNYTQWEFGSSHRTHFMGSLRGLKKAACNRFRASSQWPSGAFIAQSSGSACFCGSVFITELLQIALRAVMGHCAIWEQHRLLPSPTPAEHRLFRDTSLIMTQTESDPDA